jgi:hypothetical protein
MRLQRSTGWVGSCGDGRASDTGIRSYAHWEARKQEQAGVKAGGGLDCDRKQAFTEATVTRRTTARLYRTRRRRQRSEAARARYR